MAYNDLVRSKLIYVTGAILCFLIFGISAPANSQVQADSLWSLSSIRTDANTDDTLDYLGQEVKITGVANVVTGLLHEHYLQAFVQNDSTGMSIFATKIDSPFVAGDSLVVKGEIQRYDGLAEVKVTSYKVFGGASEVPDPKPLTEASQNPKKYIGMLVKGSGKIIEKGSTFNGKYIRLTPSDTSDAAMNVYVSNFHRLNQQFDFDVLSIGDEISVKGIITKDNRDFPDSQSYKLFLRTPDDFEYASLPRYYTFEVIGGLLIIALVIGGLIVILHRQVDNKTAEIQQSLEEKDVLLREIHHRVKNSLAIVSGLIELQLERTEDAAAQNVLKDSQSRIQSMALIHKKLYQTDSLSNIRLDNYLKELVEAIHGTFTEYTEAVDLTFGMAEVELEIDKVIPCGLLINELVVNAFKHAFSKDEQGVLEIRLQRKNGRVELTIADNGPGLPEDFTLERGDSLGSMLISTFAAQLEAETNIRNRTKGGSAFSFVFSVD